MPILPLLINLESIFKIGVKLPNSKFFIAEGASKKDAQQNAAILCLKDNT